MRAGTDLARMASLVGDPARANMLAALLGGTALTASELALEAGVTLPTASAHLARLTEGGLTRVMPQGRHRYYRLAGPEVAGMLESIMGVAATHGPRKVLPGPRDAALRQARVCYDHLAGELGVALYDRLVAGGIVEEGEGALRLGAAGRDWFAAFGIDVDGLARARRPLCRACLDWSARRSHLGGSLGAAVLQGVFDKGWARREKGSRVVAFTPPGRRAFLKLLEHRTEPKVRASEKWSPAFG